MSKEVKEAINAVENDIYDLKAFLTESEKIKWQKTIETVLNYIKLLEEERDGIYEDYQDLGKAYYDSIPKQVIRDKILYYKSFGIHKVNNGLIGENFSEWTEYVMQDEIDILNELLEEE